VCEYRSAVAEADAVEDVVAEDEDVYVVPEGAT
jgi:hypothetical protein